MKSQKPTRNELKDVALLWLAYSTLEKVMSGFGTKIDDKV
jgi:hypothetical protein